MLGPIGHHDCTCASVSSMSVQGVGRTETNLKEVDRTSIIEGIDEVASALRSLGCADAAVAVLRAWSNVEAWMRSTGRVSLELQCYTTSRILHDELKKYAIPGGIVEGDIEVGHHDYLEHRANMISMQNFFAFVDLASFQFRQTDGFMLVTTPDRDVMRAALAAEYHWL